MENEKGSVENNKESMKSRLILKTVYTVLGVMIFLFTAYHGLNSYIDTRIESKISNSDFLKRVARTVRPSLIFNVKGSILSDMGASSLINQIKVSEHKDGSLEIIVSPKEYLGIEPILESLDENYSIKVERGAKFDWIFNLSGISYYITADSPPREKSRRLFRLELVRQ